MNRSSVSAVFSAILLATAHGAFGADKASFQVNLGEDGDTIGEMRPVFLEMSSQQLPAISVKEVARRYQRLFEEAEEPEVRIDALHRLTNLHSLAGDGLELTPEQEAVIYREALKSYEMIVSQGRYQGRLDELLYQTAKAYAFIGNETQSIQRLKQLVGLYPQSGLASEARFRIAENAFSRGAYAEAETAYQQVIELGSRDDLKEKALYMKGWSQYKQQKMQQASHTFFAVLDGYDARSQGFTALRGGSEDLVNDTFRILALIAARQGGAEEVDRMLAAEGGRSYDYLLYDRLADYYLSKQRYTDSAAVNRHFVATHPAHPRTPAMQAEIVAIWEHGGFEREADDARADFVRTYAGVDAYGRLSPEEQAQWRTLARRVADTYYSAADAAGDSAGSFSEAGRFYGRLGDIHASRDEPVAAGEHWRLAGDAWLQAGRPESAIAFFEKAGYRAPGYEDSADAAWAAILLYRKQPSGGDDSVLVNAVDRFAETFPQDSRIAAAQSSLANRLMSAGRVEEAEIQAGRAVAHARAKTSVRRSSFLVLGQIAYDRADYVAAEQAYQQALELAESGDDPMEPGQLARTRDQLARSIYRQAEADAAQGQIAQAVTHYQRIAEVGAADAITRNARYDAATVLLRAEQWQPAIDNLEAFRATYPESELNSAVSEKLVAAYRASGQNARAADELLDQASQSASPWPDRLLAADLLMASGDRGRAQVIISDYLAQASKPETSEEHLRQQALRYRLISAADVASAHAIREELVQRELDSAWHSEDSLSWAAESALVLAQTAGQRFNQLKLTLPLNQSLPAKRRALEDAVARYQQADQLGGAEVHSQALFGKAELFRRLAKDIMASERPGQLNDLEQSQYGILLEEQAYPFEEKAIALHAQNHEQVGEGVYNRWIRESMDVLAEMFPGRYRRSNQWMDWKAEEVGYARAPNP